MQYTTHFNLNLPEGTDLVNPLVQDNPNYTAIDAAMFANKQAVIGTATEVTAGTVHTITRLNADSNYFRFTATSNWNFNDTMIVDATPVSVYLSDGTAPQTGTYVINSEVLCLMTGTRVTLLTSGIASMPATNVMYNLNDSVSDELDAIIPEVFKGTVGVTADGVKDYATLLNELYALVDTTKINAKSMLTIGQNVMSCQAISGSSFAFCNFEIGLTSLDAVYALFSSGTKAYRGAKVQAGGTTFSVYNTVVPPVGRELKIYY